MSLNSIYTVILLCVEIILMKTFNEIITLEKTNLHLYVLLKKNLNHKNTLLKDKYLIYSEDISLFVLSRLLHALTIFWKL